MSNLPWLEVVALAFVYLLIQRHTSQLYAQANRIEKLERNTNQLYAQANRIETLERELAIAARGYFLRDDRPIREGGGFEGREEAYSLFQKSPYERVHVYGGPKAWAVDQAYEKVFGKEAA